MTRRRGQRLSRRFQNADMLFGQPLGRDLLARLGGVEFAVLSYDVERDTARAMVSGSVRAGVPSGLSVLLGAKVGCEPREKSRHATGPFTSSGSNYS